MRRSILILLLSFLASQLVLSEFASAEPNRSRATKKKIPKKAAPIQGVKGSFVDATGGAKKSEAGVGAGSSSLDEPQVSRAPSSVPANTLLNSLGKSGAASGPSIGFAKAGGSNGSSLGNGPRASIEFDDDQAKRKPEGKEYGRGDTGPGEKDTAPPGGGGPPRQAKALKRWWPMCIFIDPSVPAGNEIVKQMVDEAAACDVNLVVFPFYMKSNYPRDAKGLVDASKQKCNAVDGMGKMGANRGSVVSLVNDITPVQQMCGGSRDVLGCSELGFDPGDGIKKRMASTGSYGGVAGPGKMAAAIVGPGGFSAKTVAGKVLGQGMMALPPGWGSGNEVGDENEGYASAGVGDEAKKGWSDYGCQKMQEAAFPNTGGKWKWNPDQKDYVVKNASASTMLDITDKRAIWKSANQPPSGGSAADEGAKPSSGDSGGMGGGGSSAASNPSEGSLPPAASANGGHKLLSGGARASGGGALNLKSLRAGSGNALRGGGSAAAIYGPSESGGGAEGGEEGGEVESAAAMAAASGNANGGVSALGGQGASVAFDDKIQKGGIGSVTVNGSASESANSGAPGALGGVIGASGASARGGLAGGKGGAASQRSVSSLQDDFFGLVDKRLKEDEAERNRRGNRGDSLRKAGSGAARLSEGKSKAIYQSAGQSSGQSSGQSDGSSGGEMTRPSVSAEVAEARGERAPRADRSSSRSRR